MRSLRVCSACTGIVLAFVLAACSSAKMEEAHEVSPLALLDTDSSIYMSIPEAQQETAVRLMTAAMPALNSADAAKIASRCDVLYAGISTVQDKSRLQLAVRGSFPAIGISASLTEKKGWSKTKKSYDGGAMPFSTNVYESAAYGGIQLAFPTPDLLCAGSDVDPLLQKFSAMPAGVPELPQFSWIMEPQADIKFYVTEPGQYIQALLGSAVELSVESTYGTLVQAQKQDTFVMDFYVQLKSSNNLAVLAMLSLVKLSFGMMGADVEQDGDTLIHITGLEVTADQIAQMFSLSR